MNKLIFLFTLSIFTFTLSSQTPTNDLIENAIEITSGFIDENVRLDLATTTDENSPNCPVGIYKKVYYKFAATSEGFLEVKLTDNSLVSTPINQSFVIIRSTPDLNQTDVSQFDNTASPCSFGDSASTAVTPGQFYYIEIHREDEGALSNISFSFSLPPENDTIENAIEITSSRYEETNVRLDLASSSPGLTSGCSVSGLGVVYYKFTPNTNGTARMSLSNFGTTDQNSFVIFYTADNLNAVSESELTHLPESPCAFGSDTTINIVAGQSYYILVNRGTPSVGTNIVADISQDGTSEERQALIDLYNATDGPNWALNENWNTTAPLSEWVNINLENGHVTSFSIATFGATGTIPNSITNLSFLKTAGLSSNNLFGVVPDFSLIPTIEDVNIGNNNFSFGDLETNFTSNSNISNFNFNNQSTIDAEIELEPNLGSDYTLSVTPDSGTNISYQWFKNRDGNEDIPIIDATNPNYELTNIQDEDLDSYFCQITSLIIPDLKIRRKLINLTGPVSQQERDALIAFYNALDGPNWTDNTNWLSNEPVGTWSFITTRGNKVIAIRIFANAGLNGQLPDEIGDLIHLERFDIGIEIGLSGPLPSTIGSLTELRRLRIQGTDNSGSLPTSIENLANLKELRIIGNNFSGDLPSGLSNLTNLEDFYVIGSVFPNANGNFNVFTGQLPDLTNSSNLSRIQVNGNDFLGELPDYSVLPNLTTLVINDNLYSFSDLATNQANNSTIENYIFSPQRNNSEPETVEIEPGTPITLNVNGMTTTTRFFSLSNTNQYQWFKDDNAISGATESTYTINAPEPSDSGVYFCEITNATVDGLVVTRADITLNVNAALSVNDIDLSNFKLYPNPVSDWLTISANNLQNKKAKVYDLNGRLIQTNELKSNISVVNVSKLTQGIYILEITDDSNISVTKRFIKH